MIHAYIKLKDFYSHAYFEKIVTVSNATFEKQKANIGNHFHKFDKFQQISSTYKVLEVRQATEQDYIKTGTQYFTNEN